MGGVYRMCISVGDRDGGPDIGLLRTHLLWARNAQEFIDCGPSLGNYITPDIGMYVPCTTGVFFVTMV